MLTGVHLASQPLGLAFAFANAGLFATYIVIAHRVAQAGISGIDGLGIAMLIATVIGLLVLAQVPTPAELIGIALVVAGVAVHRDPA